MKQRGALDAAEHEIMLEGYRFLSALDHYLRLTVGRTTRLPTANPKALNAVAQRMGLKDHNDLIEQLTLHRLNVRKTFEAIVG